MMALCRPEVEIIFGYCLNGKQIMANLLREVVLEVTD
jgi:hypothetical protein